MSIKTFNDIDHVEVFFMTKETRIKGAGGGLRGHQKDEQKQEEYKKQSSIRAGSKIRELVLANNLKYMWTLTYSEEITDIEKVKADFNNFKRNLKKRIKHEFPYVAVIEIQEERSEKAGKDILHIHFATNKRINIKKVNESWLNGFVFVSEFSGELFKVAGYLSKYIKKDIDKSQVRLKDKNRYMVSKGLARAIRTTVFIPEKDFNSVMKSADYIKEFEQGIWLKINARRWEQEKEKLGIRENENKNNKQSKIS